MSSTRAATIREAARPLSAADFPGTIRSHFPYWDVQFRPFLLDVVTALPVGQFDFKPLPVMMTARQLVLHLAETERWWVSHIVDGESYEDFVVPAPQASEGGVATIEAPDTAALLAILARWHVPTQRWLEQPVGELARTITHRPAGEAERRYSLHYILQRVQEHEIHHRAQLVSYLRLMGVEPPPVF
ncbi:MAG: DUF664 domain-containing protein [Candidatus Eisenbacteria bacterium]|uniref:DUF664 domain-containing protein n=1 Tax=Eiseniibacteriota bacterium TaxID=2212470 RepID=A0A849SM14_UNCEI|nr:DUF664 domain-containing protein [Candidatus Eisenbacteria bacterium]